MKKLFTKVLPYLLILTIVLAFFLPQMAKGKAPIPSDTIVGLYHPWRDVEINGYNYEKYPVKNPLITDPVLQTYPWRKTVINNLKNLEPPLWNPYNFSGQPLLANVQSAPFNFLNVLFLIFPFSFAWTTQIVAGSMISAIFMYLFLRSLNLGKTASLYGGITLPFSGFSVAWLTWGTIDIAASILPLMLFCLNKLSQKNAYLYFLILTFSAVVLIFSGHTQTSVYVFATASLYALYKFIQLKSWKTFLIFPLSVVIAFLITSPQLLPSLEFFNQSNRNVDQAYFPQKEDWFIPFKHLIQLVAPDFFGNPTRGNYWGVWNYGEFVSFVGIIPLIFAVHAFFKKSAKKTFFVAILCLSLLLAIKNPISELPYILDIPIISSMQPSRILLLINFSLITLSALGMEDFLKNNGRKIFASVFIVSTTLLVLLAFTLLFPDRFPQFQNLSAPKIALRNLLLPILTASVAAGLFILCQYKKARNFLTPSIIIVTIFELFYFAYKFTPFSSFNTIFPQTKITSYLQAENRPFRVLSTDRRIASPNSLEPYQIESVSGYDPLYLKRYGRFVDLWQTGEVKDEDVSFNRFITPDKYNSNIADLMNVKYVLTFDDINNSHFEKVIEEGRTKLYKNRNALNRIFPVSEIIKSSTDEEILKKLTNSESLSQIGYSRNFEFKNGDKNASVEIVNYTDQKIEVKTNASRETPIVISNVYYQGWKAYIDDKQEQLKEVNYLMQSVIVPAGEHNLKLIYKPESFYQGLQLSVVGFIILTASTVLVWKKYQS